MKATATTNKQQNRNSKTNEPEPQKETKTEIVNVRIPKDLILEIDFLVQKRIFNSRSEAIREFAREYAQESLRQNAKFSERGG